MVTVIREKIRLIFRNLKTLRTEIHLYHVNNAINAVFSQTDKIKPICFKFFRIFLTGGVTWGMLWKQTVDGFVSWNNIWKQKTLVSSLRCCCPNQNQAKEKSHPMSRVPPFQVRSQVQTEGTPHPSQVPGLDGGTLGYLLSRSHPRSGWGVPPVQTWEGYPISWMGAAPFQVRSHVRIGVPPSRTGWGTPHPWSRTGWGTPLPIRRQVSIVSTCYVAGGMPLMFTQEDFLVILKKYNAETLLAFIDPHTFHTP